MLLVVAVQYALHSVNHLIDVGEADPSWLGPANLVSLVLAAALAELADGLRRGAALNHPGARANLSAWISSARSRRANSAIRSTRVTSRAGGCWCCTSAKASSRI